MLDKIDTDESLTVTTAWKEFTIRQCIKFVGTTCAAVKKTTLNACWKPIWPACAVGKQQPDEEELHAQIVQMGRKIEGDNFCEDDIEAMMAVWNPWMMTSS